MKKILIASLIAIIISACDSKPEGFEINGKIEGAMAEGTSVYLRKTENMSQIVDVDTTFLRDGQFKFVGKQESPEMYYIFFEHERRSIPVVLENAKITVSAKKDSISYAKVRGSYQNKVFGEFIEASTKLASKAQTMNRDMRDAAAARDTAVMNSLREEYFDLQQEAKDLEVSFVKENPDALISALLIGKALATKSLPMEEIKELYEGLSPEIQATENGKDIKSKLEKDAKTAIGTKAPNFSAPTPSGEELALNDVLGKATILDFWAAWCKPCRAENPNIVKLYNKYKEQGLSIMGVSLDKRAEDWKKAIADDGLEWHQVSNVQYFDEIAELYNVSAIPATFILDRNGIIVAKNLRGPALEEKIAELLQ